MSGKVCRPKKEARGELGKLDPTSCWNWSEPEQARGQKTPSRPARETEMEGKPPGGQVGVILAKGCEYLSLPLPIGLPHWKLWLANYRMAVRGRQTAPSAMLAFRSVSLNGDAAGSEQRFPSAIVMAPCHKRPVVISD